MIISFLSLELLAGINISETVKWIGLFAGIGGFAILFLAIVFKEMLRSELTKQLGKTQAYRILRLTIICSTVVAVIGIGAFVVTKLVENKTQLDGHSTPKPSITPLQTIAKCEKPSQTSIISIDLKNDSWIDVTKTAGSTHFAGHLANVPGKIQIESIPANYGIYVFINDVQRGNKDGWWLQATPVTMENSKCQWNIDEISFGDENSPIKKTQQFQIVAVVADSNFRDSLAENKLLMSNQMLEKIPAENKSEKIIIHIGEIKLVNEIKEEN
jgi:hypothetical protein